MGNKLHEEQNNISIDPKFAHDYQDQSSEYSESDDQSEASQLNWWQKLIYRDQQHLHQKAPSSLNNPNLPNHQRLKRQQEGRIRYTPQSIAGKANSQDQARLFQHLATDKFVFTQDMQQQAQKIKLDWKLLSQFEHSTLQHSSTTHQNYRYSFINILKLLKLTNTAPSHPIYFCEYRQKIIPTLDSSLIVAQKIQINDCELTNHITRYHMFAMGQFNSTIDSQIINQAKLLNELIYKWRVFVSKMALWHHEQSFPIVGVYEVDQSRFNISFEPKTVIYQELILYRMNDIRNLSHLQGIYVLEHSLVGFKMLYDIFGHFLVEESMIGFNSLGQLKVWISPFFWSNFCYSTPKSPHSQMDIAQNRLYLGYKRYQEQDMVGRIWMIVQKYSLFHQSILMQSGGFMKCNFQQALQIIIRHKGSIINRREKSLGLVEFVHHLQFESQHDKPQTFCVQNKSIQNINRPLIQESPHSQHSKVQKPLMKPAITPSSASTNYQSHIMILPHTQAKPAQTRTKRRKQIFARQYTHTMSNNMDQTHSMIQSEYVLKSNHRSSDSLFRDRTQPNSHVRFINIKSVK